MNLNLWSSYIDGSLGLGRLWATLALVADAGAWADVSWMASIGVAKALLLARHGAEIACWLHWISLR